MRQSPAFRDAGLVGAQIATMAYVEEFQVRLPVMDEDGYLTPIPDAHILDAAARARTFDGEDPAALPLGYDTVAIVAELAPCDMCDWGAARYECRLRDGIAALCLCCLVQRGDPVLGLGRSVLMLVEEEIPDHLVMEIHNHVDFDDWARPDYALGHGWDAFRRWGFYTGPTADGRLYGVICGMQMSIEPGPPNTPGGELVKVVARRPGLRHMYAPGGDEHWILYTEDELDARAMLMEIVRAERSTPRWRSEAEAHFRVPPAMRDARALEALDERGGGPMWLHLGETPLCRSGDHLAAEEAATSSTNPAVLERLALEHPASDVRVKAIENPRLEPTVLEQAAASPDGLVMSALLRRADLPPAGTALVVQGLLLAGRIDPYALTAALIRADFPDPLLDSAVERLYALGTEARTVLAELIHEAPPARRDRVHEHLLRKARKISSTVALIKAVIGEDSTRVEWCRATPDYGVRSLMTWFEAQEPESTEDADATDAASVLVPATGTSASQVKGPAAFSTTGSDHTDPPRAAADFTLSAPAVSARLRRWWLTDAVQDEDLLASDLGDVLTQCRLVRVGSDLHIKMPYDFGDGAPIVTSVADRLVEEVASLTGGAVRILVWAYEEERRPTTRRRSSNLDVYEIGDPLAEDYAEIAAELAGLLRREAGPRALEALSDLHLAGVSRHRLWLSLATPANVTAIGTTPGAAASLKIAVSKLQRRKPLESLYDVVADPSPHPSWPVLE